MPSGLYATEDTDQVCPLRVACSLPVAASHSLIVWSKLPEASVLPSGLYATEDTPPVCPLRVACSLPVTASAAVAVSPLRHITADPGHSITADTSTFTKRFMSRTPGWLSDHSPLITPGAPLRHHEW